MSWKRSTKPQNLRKVLQTSILSTGIVVFALAFIVSVYLASVNFEKEENEQRSITHKTLAELILPALSISDYGEVNRVLGLVSKKNEIHAVVTSEGDFLLSDYANLNHFSFLPIQRFKAVRCQDVLKLSHPSHTSYDLTCHDLIEKNELSMGNKSYGIMLSLYPKKVFFFEEKQILYLALFAAVTLALAIIFLRKILEARFLKPIENLVVAIKGKIQDPLQALPYLENISIEYEEILDIKSAYESLMSSLQQEYKIRSDMEKHSALFQLAQQVAHDIRSPLAALDVATSHASGLSEEQRLLIRSAVQRIQDIANDLANQNHQPLNTTAQSNLEKTSIHLLSSLIEPLITEKRLQYRAKIDIHIESYLGEPAYGLFAKVETVEFKRLLSNLINNSVEALDDKGSVSVRLHNVENEIFLEVKDNGKGIPVNILPQLTQRGLSFGKVGGSGLGLSHARLCVETWGGRLQIASQENQGTTITITLPKQDPPNWFLPELALESNSILVILDDDNSIHNIWRSKFEKQADAGHVTLLHFSQPDELIKWHARTEIQEKIFYLCDYEFLRHEQNGLDVIERLSIQGFAALVTSRFEEEKIRKRCEELNVKLLPKNLAGFVPVRLVASKLTATNIDCVLLDDDELVHLNWKMASKVSEKNLLCFRDEKNLLTKLSEIPKNVPIYIDSNLAQGVKGENVAKNLFDLGFTNLYLATGYEKQHFISKQWIKDIVGKSPPWE